MQDRFLTGCLAGPGHGGLLWRDVMREDSVEQDAAQNGEGRLFVVATPLGNVADLSPRAAEVLSTADVVLAEDTRRTGLLLKQLGIAARRLVSFHEHNETDRLPQVLAMLAEGLAVAQVSDAGTPLLADPGYRLVCAAREAGYAVSPVPGPSAILAALSAAGLAPYPFSFLGFPPRGTTEARSLFERFGATGASLVFFERKNRLHATLAVALEALGDRDCVLCRELTKTFEEFIPGKLADLAGRDLELLGEVTVVVGPGSAARSTEAVALAVVRAETAGGGKPKEIARRALTRLSGWTLKELYAMLLDQRTD